MVRGDLERVRKVGIFKGVENLRKVGGIKICLFI